MCLRRLSAALLALLLALTGAATAEVATDLGGGFQGTIPEDELQVAQVDMENADVTIGYIDPGYLSLSPVTTGVWDLVSVNQLVFESVVTGLRLR